MATLNDFDDVIDNNILCLDSHKQFTTYTFLWPVNTSSEQCPCSALTVWEPSGHSPPAHLCLLTNMSVFTSSTRSVGVSFDFAPQNYTGSFFITFISQSMYLIFVAFLQILKSLKFFIFSYRWHHVYYYFQETKIS